MLNPQPTLHFGAFPHVRQGLPSKARRPESLR